MTVSVVVCNILEGFSFRRRLLQTHLFSFGVFRGTAQRVSRIRLISQAANWSVRIEGMCTVGSSERYQLRLAGIDCAVHSYDNSVG